VTGTGGEETREGRPVASEVTVRWKGEGLLFAGSSVHGGIDVGSGSDAPGQGPTPMELLLLGLGGCTGIDVVSILVKMRQPVEEFWVEVRGQKREEHPQIYTDIEVVYHLRGDLDERKVQRAIGLSETRYCGAEAMLGKAAAVTSRYVLER